MSLAAKVITRKWPKPTFNLKKGYRSYRKELIGYINGLIPNSDAFLTTEFEPEVKNRIQKPAEAATSRRLVDIILRQEGFAPTAAVSTVPPHLYIPLQPPPSSLPLLMLSMWSMQDSLQNGSNWRGSERLNFWQQKARTWRTERPNGERRSIKLSQQPRKA